MAISDFSKKYHEKMFPGYRSAFLGTDPEFIERFDNFAFDEVVTSDDLDDKTRFTAILSSLLGCQGIDEYRAAAGGAQFRRHARRGQRDRLSIGRLPRHR